MFQRSICLVLFAPMAHAPGVNERHGRKMGQTKATPERCFAIESLIWDRKVA